jgi:flavodoxin
MKLNTTRMALAAVIALAAFGTADAATKPAHPATTQATCDALAKQAGSAFATHKADVKTKAAQAQREQGEKECKAGNYAVGAEHLRRAINDLGMKPLD